MAKDGVVQITEASMFDHIPPEGHEKNRCRGLMAFPF
jgi:hypothetical protein